jgi:folate-dependent phosphoribosylglycinamide formyltransferase PurN
LIIDALIASIRIVVIISQKGRLIRLLIDSQKGRLIRLLIDYR